MSDINAKKFDSVWDAIEDDPEEALRLKTLSKQLIENKINKLNSPDICQSCNGTGGTMTGGPCPECYGTGTYSAAYSLLNGPDYTLFPKSHYAYLESRIFDWVNQWERSGVSRAKAIKKTLDEMRDIVKELK